MTDLLHTLTTRDSLLAIGISLVVAGIILRTFARAGRRAAALRQQHRLHHKKLGEAIHEGGTDANTGWFERHLSLLANGVVGAGLVLVVLSWMGK
jgi:hypothetical protein